MRLQKKIQVQRLTNKAYTEIVAKLGSSAKHVEVPSQTHDAFFIGVYTNFLKTAIVIPWPVDRPLEAQEAFAKENRCGFPVEYYQATNRSIR